MKDIVPKPTRKKRSATFWHAVTLFVSLGALSLAAWVSYAPFLDTPRDVAHTRKLFIGVKNSFCNNPHYWHSKRSQVERRILKDVQERNGESIPFLVRDITPEMLLSYAVDTLHMPLSTFDSVALYPKISGSSFIILISKLENSLWPLSVIVSLEIEVRIESQGAKILFRRLRRGTQELSTTQASMYFGSDLERKCHFHDGCFFNFF